MIAVADIGPIVSEERNVFPDILSLSVPITATSDPNEVLLAIILVNHLATDQFNPFRCDGVTGGYIAPAGTSWSNIEGQAGGNAIDILSIPSDAAYAGTTFDFQSEPLNVRIGYYLVTGCIVRVTGADNARTGTQALNRYARQAINGSSNTAFGPNDYDVSSPPTDAAPPILGELIFGAYTFTPYFGITLDPPSGNGWNVLFDESATGDSCTFHAPGVKNTVFYKNVDAFPSGQTQLNDNTFIDEGEWVAYVFHEGVPSATNCQSDFGSSGALTTTDADVIPVTILPLTATEITFTLDHNSAGAGPHPTATWTVVWGGLIPDTILQTSSSSILETRIIIPTGATAYNLKVRADSATTDTRGGSAAIWCGTLTAGGVRGRSFAQVVG